MSFDPIGLAGYARFRDAYVGELNWNVAVKCLPFQA